MSSYDFKIVSKLANQLKIVFSYKEKGLNNILFIEKSI